VAQVNTKPPLQSVPFVLGITGTPLSTAVQSVPGTTTSRSCHCREIVGYTSSWDSYSVISGKELEVSPHATTMSSTAVQDVARTHMEWIHALVWSRLRAVSPYKAEAWEQVLGLAGLLGHYSKIPQGLREGFSFHYLLITSTQVPPNKDSVMEFAEAFQDSVTPETWKGCYIGLYLRQEVEIILGPFQTSPFSIIPKPGKPGKFCLIQNLSFLCSPSQLYPNPSINSGINSDDFPWTWGTFNTICLLISHLPPGLQAAV